jgi:flagellar operon protein
MSNGNVNNFLIPNVSKLPSQKKVNTPKATPSEVQNSEFGNLLKGKLEKSISDNNISLSTHAAKRISERNLVMDNKEITKLNNALKKLEAKGGQESLVITEKAAYIVDVPNKKVVTAMDRESLLDNVFTKIDSTVMV